MKKNNQPIVSRGDIYYASLSPVVGSEQGGLRPVVIVQNNVGNKHAPTTIVAPITSRLTKKPLPTHVFIEGCGLSAESVILLEQVRVIDKQRLKEKMGSLDGSEMNMVNQALSVSLGLGQV